jgi:hypothetical protein
MGPHDREYSKEMFSFDATLVLLELVISKDYIYSVIEALSSNYRDLYTFGLIWSARLGNTNH